MRVIGLVLSTRFGEPSSLNPLRTFILPSGARSGWACEISPSLVRRPRSTHCKAAREVSSLVQEAIHIVVSREKGLATNGDSGLADWVPEAWL